MANYGGGLAAYRAVGTLYNALMTALILGLVTRRGEDIAREYVLRHFRRQHLEKFLPGLQKLGLADEPDAPACALYHYHSNALGGVKTEYVRESDGEGLGPVSAAAVDLGRRVHLRHPEAGSMPPCCTAGTATTASASAIRGWALSAPGRTVDGQPPLVARGTTSSMTG